MKIEVKLSKSEVEGYLVSVKNSKVDETAVFDRNDDAEKCVEFIKQVFGADYSQIEIYTGVSVENSEVANPAVVARCDNSDCFVFVTENLSAATIVATLAKILAVKMEKSKEQ